MLTVPLLVVLVSVRLACEVDVVVGVVVMMVVMVVVMVVGCVSVVERVVLESGEEVDELATGVGWNGSAGEGIGSGVTKILQSAKALVSLAIACMSERMLYEESLRTSTRHIKLNPTAMSNTGFTR